MTKDKITFSLPKPGKKTVIGVALASIFTIEANLARTEKCENAGLLGLLNPLSAIGHSVSSLRMRNNGIASMCRGNDIPFARHFK